MSFADALCGARPQASARSAAGEDEETPTCVQYMQAKAYLGLMGMFCGIPDGPWDEGKAPPAPDYGSTDAWICIPSKASVLAALVPPDELTAEPASTVDQHPGAPDMPPSAGGADVFFVHSSGYFGSEWNAAFDDPACLERTNLFASGQIPAFHGLCRVYAPQYREAAIGAFFCTRRDDARQAFDLAYSDVRRAFEHYLAHHNKGRPFFIASHSQGSGHASRLLEDVVEPRHADLGKLLVAAYLIGAGAGAGVPKARFEHLPHIPPCDAPDQLCCAVGWDCRAGGAPGEPYPPLYHTTWPGAWYGGKWRVAKGDGVVLGTNPYTWRDSAPAQGSDALPSASSLSLGVLLPRLHDPHAVIAPKLNVKEMNADRVSGFVPAQLCLLAPATAFPGAKEPAAALDVCFDPQTNWLIAPNIPTDGGFGSRFTPMPDGRFHVQDWSLFFGSIRQNVQHRLDAHKKKYGGLIGPW